MSHLPADPPNNTKAPVIFQVGGGRGSRNLKLLRGSPSRFQSIQAPCVGRLSCCKTNMEVLCLARQESRRVTFSENAVIQNRTKAPKYEQTLQPAFKPTFMVQDPTCQLSSMLARKLWVQTCPVTPDQNMVLSHQRLNCKTSLVVHLPVTRT
jgi:hypothetical protein